MKLSQLLVSSGLAWGSTLDSTVYAVGPAKHGQARISSCTNSYNEIVLHAHLSKDSFPSQPDGWDENDMQEWTKAFNLNELSRAIDEDSNELIIFKTLDIAVNGDHTDFFQHDVKKIAFKCRFSLDDQNISQDLHISTHDTVHATDGSDVQSSGKLAYTLHTDRNSFKLGERIKFSITPNNPDVVYARIKYCEVSNEKEKYIVFGDPEYPYCTDIYTDFRVPELMYSGSLHTQTFSFLAFKWYDTSTTNDEDQQFSCALEFSLTPFTPVEVTTCEGDKLIKTTTETPTLPPTETTTTVMTAACKYECKALKRKIKRHQKLLDNKNKKGKR